jgi:hypothetical protein
MSVLSGNNANGGPIRIAHNNVNMLVVISMVTLAVVRTH